MNKISTSSIIRLGIPRHTAIPWSDLIYSVGRSVVVGPVIRILFSPEARERERESENKLLPQCCDTLNISAVVRNLDGHDIRNWG